MSGPAGLARSLEAIDAANAEDPEEIAVGERRGPKAWLHGLLATEWLARLVDDPADATVLAARGHHFRRWTHPRDAYPAGRAGYLRWRAAARTAQAEELAALLRQVGATPDAAVEEVARLVRKEGRDALAQLHEDIVCLVFFEAELAPTAGRLAEGGADLQRVLVRTLGKMSPAARALAPAAVPEQPLRDVVRGLV